MSENGESRFWQASPDYHGVIASAEGVRLAVSPNGKRYLVQVPAPDGTFVVRHRRARLERLLPDVPEAIKAQGLDWLPDNPADFPRAWAAETEALRERMRRASKYFDEYDGVIAAAGPVRLVLLTHPARYALQVKDVGRWEQVASGRTRDPLVRLVWGERPVEGLAEACVGLRELKEALHRVPAEALDYVGRKPKALAAVRVQRPADVTPSERRAERRRAPAGRGERRRGVDSPEGWETPQASAGARAGAS